MKQNKRDALEKAGFKLGTAEEFLTPKIKWLLEDEVFQDEDEALVEALDELGVDYSLTKFGKSYEDHIAEIKHTDHVIFHGSLQFAKLILRKTNWVGVYCNLPMFECLYYYPRFGKHLLNSNYVVLPFGDLDRRKSWLFDHLSEDDALFVRPSSGYKTFTGKVVTKKSWDTDVGSFGCFGLRIDPESPVIIAPPIEIAKEWRTIVVGNKIIAASQYKDHGELLKDGDVPDKVINYGQDVLNSISYSPDPAWVLDLCETESGDLKVLEVGSFSCSGFYECDLNVVVKSLNSLVAGVDIGV